MNSLVRNQTTAAEAMALEDGIGHPMPIQEGKLRKSQYFTMLRDRRELPVSGKREEFLALYQSEQVLVVVGATGSGKSTQIPQFVLFDEWGSKLKIACTHPRRIAASSVAKRVAEEMAVPLGDEVGYRVRFGTKMSDKTRLVYMTDGMLLSLAKGDLQFSKYSCIIVDEAHERTIATDILMALLKNAMSTRKDLKVVIMSATLDAAKFQAYFGGAKLLEVPGRTFPVDIKYLPEDVSHYTSAALRTVKHIHNNMGPGDILVFLTSISEIEQFCSEARASTHNLEMLALYSGIGPEKESLALAKSQSSSRKCVVATNVAETSVTIDGIVYVVDTGLVKQEGFSPRAGLHQLYTSNISKAAAGQRAGRAGRTQPGVCYRLYTEETHDNIFLDSAPPGLLTKPLNSKILMLSSIGFESVGLFDFMDRPHCEVYYHGLEELINMGYFETSGKITDKGREAAKLPVDPVWYNAMVEGRKFGCLIEILGIAALTAAQSQHSIFLRSVASRNEADACRQTFAHPMSDHVSQLNLLHAYVQVKKTKSEGEWCQRWHLDRRVLEEALRIRGLLVRCAKARFGDIEVGNIGPGDKNYTNNICKALARSLFCNVAIRDPGIKAAKGKGPIVENEGDLYMTVHRNHHASLHPDSALVGIKHEWVVFDRFVHSGWHQHLHTVTAIKPEWVMDLPYFQDEMLAVKRSGVLRQPYVKASLDQACEKAAAASTSTST
ncbi:hypothetical protein CEP54_006039 [Fusarium duplospermum]|uniref:RNA helicase n=1 Tax=Fusarium duplospermum TaxID=1325734 RepID=A0A428Q9H0_9HYPO|nr:hypothetical protein CEP54_006039 [Fusarium duplospermum]